jgi:hypothetical protein
MKPTKRILKIAQQVVKDDDWLSKQEDRDQWVNHVASILTRIKKSMFDGRYYSGVESVSKSGMSRIINIKWIENNSMSHAPDYVYRLAGCDKNRRISGCGMDMLFAAQYNLFQILCDQKRTPYQTHMKSYRSL